MTHKKAFSELASCAVWNKNPSSIVLRYDALCSERIFNASALSRSAFNSAGYSAFQCLKLAASYCIFLHSRFAFVWIDGGCILLQDFSIVAHETPELVEENELKLTAFQLTLLRMKTIRELCQNISFLMGYPVSNVISR